MARLGYEKGYKEQWPSLLIAVDPPWDRFRMILMDADSFACRGVLSVHMENLDDPEVQAWMNAQNNHARSVLAKNPGRQKLLVRIRELDQSAPAQVSDVSRFDGDVYFYRKLLAGEDVDKLYMRRGLNGEEKLVIDPEKIKLAPASQGKGKARSTTPSSDSKYVAVNIVPGGAERENELHVIETASGRDLGEVVEQDELQNTEGGMPRSLPDSRSFVYGSDQKLPPGAPVTDLYQKYRSYRNVLGTDTQKDPPVFGCGVSPSIPVYPLHATWLDTRPGANWVVGLVDTGTMLHRAYIAPIDAIRKSYSAWRKIADFSDDVRRVSRQGPAGDILPRR